MSLKLWPDCIEGLWLHKQQHVSFSMRHKQLEREEQMYQQRLQDIRNIGSHYIPIGRSMQESQQADNSTSVLHRHDSDRSGAFLEGDQSEEEEEDVTEDDASDIGDGPMHSVDVIEEDESELSQMDILPQHITGTTGRILGTSESEDLMDL